MIHSIEEVEALGGYSLILADPAWPYAQGGRGSTEKHYETMSLEDICQLQVARIAAKDAVLALWGTWPNLPMAMETIPRWGFTYKTCGFVWVKHHEKSGKDCIGGGFWTRANTEFCLIGVRGDPPKRVDKAIRQLIHENEEEYVLRAPRGRHSAKPPEARERLVRLLGDIPRIELFARERVDGWDAWGLEVPGGSDVNLSVQESVLVAVVK